MGLKLIHVSKRGPVGSERTRANVINLIPNARDLTEYFLTHWGRDNMAAIFQMTFSNAFSWMKMYELRLRFHWSLFLSVPLTISHIDSDNGLAPTRWQAIIWTNDGIVYWCIYASLCLNELMLQMHLSPEINLFSTGSIPDWQRCLSDYNMSQIKFSKLSIP